MTFETEVSAEFAHLKALFSKDAAKAQHFLTPIISDMAKIVAADAANDLPLAVDAVEAAVAAGTDNVTALGAIAISAVNTVIKNQAVAVGQEAIQATTAAIVAAGQSAAAAAPVATLTT